MHDAEIIRYLRKIPLFKDIALEEFKPGGDFSPLVGIVHEATYEAGDLLFSQGDSATRLYYIVEGKVAITRVNREGITAYIKNLGPGDSVGETGCLIGDVHDASAEVVVPTHVLYIEQSEFSELLDNSPRLADRLNLNEEIERRLALPEFDWLRDDELVIFARRRHWAQLVRRVTPVVLILLITLPAFILLLELAPLEDLVGIIVNIVAGLVNAVFLGIVIWRYVNWRDDAFVLTTDRIVHFEREWPVRAAFEEAPLEKVEDIAVIQSGFAANALNYGDLILQTAGEQVDIDLTTVPRPNELRSLIFREIERKKAREVVTGRSDIRRKLKDRLFRGKRSSPEEFTASEPQKVSSALVAVTAVKDYFFPPSWSVSEDQMTIYWRRFWLPGFVRYFWTFALWAAWTLLGAAALTLGWLPGTAILIGIWIIGEVVTVSLVLWYLEDWRNDYFELSPGRITLVFQEPLLLDSRRQETRLNNIQNISSEVPNLFARMFNYGHVMFETAGTEGRFELKWIRYPERARAEISERQQEFNRRQREVQERRFEKELLRWFDVYDEMRHASGRPPAPAEEIEEESKDASKE